jgi:transposase-like protein
MECDILYLAKVVQTIVTGIDGLRAHETAIPKELYNKHARVNNPHVRLKDSLIKPNNNIVERLNGTFKERMKVMRSLSSDAGADAYVKGMQTYYKYAHINV